MLRLIGCPIHPPANRKWIPQPHGLNYLCESLRHWGLAETKVIRPLPAVPSAGFIAQHEPNDRTGESSRCSEATIPRLPGSPPRVTAAGSFGMMTEIATRLRNWIDNIGELLIYL